MLIWLRIFCDIFFCLSVHPLIIYSRLEIQDLPCTTVLKLQNVSVYQILREINFGKCKNSKNAIFGLYFSKNGSGPLKSMNLISRKIWLTGNSEISTLCSIIGIIKNLSGDGPLVSSESSRVFSCILYFLKWVNENRYCI